MAAWQTYFHVIPRRALTAAASPLAPALLDATDWWTGIPLPIDYRDRLNAVVPSAASASTERETWGFEDSNFVDLDILALYRQELRMNPELWRASAH